MADLLIYTAWSLDPEKGTGVAVALQSLRNELERRNYPHEFRTENYRFRSFSAFVFKRALANLLLPLRLKPRPRVLMGVDFDGYRAESPDTIYVLNLRSDFSRIKRQERGWMRLLSLIEESLQRRACRRADLIIVASHHTAAAVRENYETGTTPLLVIPNGLGDEWKAPPPPLPDEPVILSVASLYPRKGIVHLVRALKIVRDRGVNFRHIHLGGGVLYDELRAETRRLGLEDRIHWAGGSADREVVRETYRQARIFCHPCLHEDFGNVFLEAMGMGRPVIAFDNTGAREIVAHETDGLLVPDRNEAALAEALIRLLQDPALCARLGRAGAAKARRYDWSETARRFIAALDAVEKK